MVDDTISFNTSPKFLIIKQNRKKQQLYLRQYSIKGTHFKVHDKYKMLILGWLFDQVSSEYGGTPIHLLQKETQF